jgi:hypothetical protein
MPLIHRAVFGDMKGAHNLIVATLGVPDTVLHDPAWHYTDRLLPADMPWGAYECGYPLRDYYILTRTFPVKASRPGMVQTHALLLPLSVAIHQPFLVPLLDLLPTDADRTITTASVLSPIPASAVKGLFEPPPMPDGYPSVVRALLNEHPLVWVGQTGFVPIIAHLWFQLWPEARRELRFRVSEAPKDLDDWPATIVNTLPSLRVHWGGQLLLDQTARTLDSPTRAEAYLMGLSEGQSLGAARERLGIPLSSPVGLKRLELYVTMLEKGTTDGTRVAVRLLGAMAPEPTQATAEKKVVLARLADETADGAEDDVLGLRNMDVSPFSTANTVLREAIARWLLGCVKKGQGGEIVAREALLVRNPWERTARAAFGDIIQHWDRKVAALLWTWWTQSDQPN